nr:hypothetical transcript [Hymenolepis microstoma]
MNGDANFSATSNEFYLTTLVKIFSTTRFALNGGLKTIRKRKNIFLFMCLLGPLSSAATAEYRTRLSRDRSGDARFLSSLHCSSTFPSSRL